MNSETATKMAASPWKPEMNSSPNSSIQETASSEHVIVGIDSTLSQKFKAIQLAEPCPMNNDLFNNHATLNDNKQPLTLSKDMNKLKSKSASCSIIKMAPSSKGATTSSGGKDRDASKTTSRSKSSSDVMKVKPMAEGDGDVTWRLFGDVETLRRTRCRRVYARSGRQNDLALFYRQGKFHCLSAWCSHMGGPLFEGDIEDYKGNSHVMCPWHAYMFDLDTGMSDIGLKVGHRDIHIKDRGNKIQIKIPFTS